VFCIMADLFYANYNITGSCSIWDKSKNFYRNKRFRKCLWEICYSRPFSVSYADKQLYRTFSSTWLKSLRKWQTVMIYHIFNQNLQVLH
jgi:hypothetical protein